MANLGSTLFLVVALLVSALAASAQAPSAPRVEVFGGYSLLHTPGADTTFHGWDTSATVNFNRWLGFEADVSAVYFDYTFFYPADNEGRPDRTLKSYGYVSHYLFGPKFALRRSRYIPFAHALFGMSHGIQHNTLSVPGGSTSFDGSVNQFAMALGGGLDLNLSRRIALRPLQADYVLDRFYGLNVNRFRYSSGVVFRF